MNICEKPICCILNNTNEILEIVQDLKCEVDLSSVLNAISDLTNVVVSLTSDVEQLTKEITLLKEQLVCDLPHLPIKIKE